MGDISTSGEKGGLIYNPVAFQVSPDLKKNMESAKIPALSSRFPKGFIPRSDK